VHVVERLNKVVQAERQLVQQLDASRPTKDSRDARVLTARRA